MASDCITLQGEFLFYVEAQITLVLNKDYVCSPENDCIALSLGIRPIKACLFREGAACKVAEGPSGESGSAAVRQFLPNIQPGLAPSVGPAGNLHGGGRRRRNGPGPHTGGSGCLGSNVRAELILALNLQSPRPCSCEGGSAGKKAKSQITIALFLR